MKNVFLLHFFIRFHSTAQQSILLLLLLSCHVDYLFVWPAKAPEDEAQAAVRVEADGDLSGRVKLTLQLDGAAEGTGGCVRHLNSSSNGHNTHNIWIYRQKCEVFHFHFLRGNKNLSAPPVWEWKWLINQKNVHSAPSARSFSLQWPRGPTHLLFSLCFGTGAARCSSDWPVH